jgi:hypothetical protein
VADRVVLSPSRGQVRVASTLDEGRAPFPIAELAREIGSFLDIAAAVTHLDLVISVDTAALERTRRRRPRAREPRRGQHHIQTMRPIQLGAQFSF